MKDLYAAIFGDSKMQSSRVPVHDLGAVMAAYAADQISLLEIRKRFSLDRESMREFHILLERGKNATDPYAFAVKVEAIAMLEESGEQGLDRPKGESARDRRNRFWQKI